MFVFIFLILGFPATLGALQTDIDLNRIVQLPKKTSNAVNQQYNAYDRRSFKPYQFSRINDYDDLSWHHKLTSLQQGATSEDQKSSNNIHQPKENPRLFYQSDSYLKEVNGFGICVKCPHDITLIAKAGSAQVMLQSPRLFTCSGHKASPYTRFVYMYGPKFGSLIGVGSHSIVGRLKYKNKDLHLCKMQVHVVTQGCVTPKYLVSHCEVDRSTPCSFTCRDPKLELNGESSLVCGDNLNWIGDLPVCKVRAWCEAPPPPEFGRFSCKGRTAGSGPGLLEGSRCRVRCVHGSQPSPRSVTACRRGAWTHRLSCLSKR